MKEVSYTALATRQLRKLPSNARDRVIEKLHRYAETGAGDVKTLTGQPGARLLVGAYRATFVETVDTISVRAVGHRREIHD